MTEHEPTPPPATPEGGRAEYESLVREHGRYAYALAFRLLADADEAKDVVQEAFIRIWKHFHLYDPRRKFTTWLYRIVTNISIDSIRNRTRTASGPLPDDDCLDAIAVSGKGMSEIAAEKDLARLVRLLSVRLPLKQRIVFTLRDMQEMEMDEIASLLRMSRNAVKTNLHYARKRVRDILEREFHITGF